MIYGLQEWGGISSCFTELLPRMAAYRGMLVHLLLPETAKSGGPRHARIIRPRRVVFLGSRPVRALRRLVVPLTQEFEKGIWRLRCWEQGACVFHSTYYTRFPVDGLPQVVTVYDMIHELFPQLFNQESDDVFRARKRQAVAAATRIIAISRKTKEDLCRIYHLPEERVEVIHLAVHDRYFADASVDQEQALRSDYGLERPYLFYVGGRSGYKNFARLVEAFAGSRLKDRLNLAVAGLPWAPDETSLLRQHCVEERVRLFVSPSDAELRALYRGAAAFVYPSLYEGFGLPVLEAMACGTPVAAARAGSIPEVAGDAASYFDPADPGDMIQAVEKLLDPQVAKELRDRGPERARTFSWDRAARQTHDLYRQLV